MRFCFIILCHLYLLSRLPFSRVIHSERIFHCGIFHFDFKVNALRMSLNLNAALSSFIAASPRLIHHSKTLHWKKNKKKNLSRDQNTICVWTSILIVVVVARAGLFTVRQKSEWPHMFLFIFTLRYVIAPFRYLSRPPISAALAPALHHAYHFIGKRPVGWKQSANFATNF